MAEVVLNPAAMANMLSSPVGMVGRWLYAQGRKVETVAKQLAPVDQGHLRASIRAEIPVPIAGRLVCYVGSPLQYARFVHDGTGIYGPRGAPIRPIRGKFLRWEARGSSRGGSRPLSGPYVFARQVSGARGRPFLRDALAAVWR